MNFSSKKALYLMIFIVLSLNVLASNQLISFQGRIGQSGNSLSSGNITIYLYDSAINGNHVWNDTFTNAVSNGYFDVVLGSNKTLNLVYGAHYYLDMDVNGQNINWSGNDRIEFESGVGAINLTTQNMNVSGNINASNFTISSFTCTGNNKLYTDNSGNIICGVDKDTVSNVTADGIQGYITQFFNQTSLINSIIYQNSTTDNIGIGTTSPSAKLDVNGSIKTNENITADWFHGKIEASQIQNAEWVNVSQIVNTSNRTNYWNNVKNWTLKWFYTNGESLDFNETLLNDTIDTRVSLQDTKWNITNSNYLDNQSDILQINETRLNQTIDARDTNTIYTNQSPITIIDTTISLTNCSTGQILKFSASGWACDVDMNTISNSTANGTTGYIAQFENETTLKSSAIYQNQTNNNIGIGTSNTPQKLTVAGDVNASNLYGNINASYVQNTYWLNATDQRYNESGRVDALNTTLITNYNTTAQLRTVFVNTSIIANCSSGFIQNITSGGIQCALPSIASETDPIFSAQNTSIWGNISAKLNASDQRYNESGRVDALNTSKIQNGSTANLSSLIVVNNITASNFLGNVNASYIQNAPWITTTSYQSNASGWKNNSENTTTQLKVGIGTLSPTQKLDVNGSINISGASGRLYFNDGSSLSSNSTLITLTNTTWITNNVGNWSLDKSGYNTTTQLRTVFVNTSIIANCSSGQFVQNITSGGIQCVSPSVTVSYQSSAAAWSNNSENTTTQLKVGIGTASPIEKLNVNGSLRVDNSTGSSVFFINSTSGNVGIGTNNPTQKLYVNGIDGASAGIYLNSAVPSSTTYTLYNNAGTLTWNGIALATGASVSGTLSYIPKFTGSDSLGDSNIYQNATTNNIGIGTISPTQKLDVNGSIIASNGGNINATNFYGFLNASYIQSAPWINNSEQGALNVNSSTYWNGVNNWITKWFYADGENLNFNETELNATIDARIGNAPVSYQSSASGWSNNSENTTTQLNVGIGTLSPTQKLDVNGSINISGASGRLYFNDGTSLTSNSSLITSSNTSWLVNSVGNATAVNVTVTALLLSNTSTNLRIDALNISKIQNGTSANLSDLTVVNNITASNLLGNVNASYIQYAPWITTTPYQSNASGWVNNSQNTTTQLNVGIGTTTPTQKLDVNGNINVSSSTGQISIGGAFIKKSGGDIIISDG